MGWQKALPEEDVRELAEAICAAYVDQVRHYVDGGGRGLRAAPGQHRRRHPRGAADGAVVHPGRGCSTAITVLVDHDRQFRRGRGVRELGTSERPR